MSENVKKKKSYTTNKAKMLVASTIVASAVVGIDAITEVNKVDAALGGKTNDLQHGETIKLNDNEYYVVKQEAHGVKVISKQYSSVMFDPDEQNNTFNPMDLNNVGYQLNTTFYNSLSEEVKSMLVKGSWNIGSNGRENSNTVEAYVGLLTKSEWESQQGNTYFGGKIPVISTGIEPTLTPSGLTNMYYVIGDGYLNAYNTPNTNSYVRPVLVIKHGLTVMADGTVKSNSAPTTPTLTVPTTQFEHGDKYFIGWNATDANNDTLTYTLQASYNGGEWENLYTGTAKTFEYTVPNNRGTSVKFRVIASDGQLTSTSAESATKSIREVMYYWNKYSAKNETTEITVNTNQSSSITSNSTTGYTSYVVENGRYVANGILTELRWPGQTLYYVSSNGLNLHVMYGYEDVPGSNMYTYYETMKTIRTTNNFVKDKLLESNIQGGYNAYPNGQKASDGFIYERGQRVLADDVTPPIIELFEQSTPAATTTVTVKTYDLGTVQTVKWAKGEQNIAYFASNGIMIGTGQGTPSTFSVSENGIYTVYAIDNKGNAAVQTIEVRNANTVPVITSVTPTKKFDVVDDTTNAKINVSATDREQTNLTASVLYNGHTATQNFAGAGSTLIELLGRNYMNGFYDTDITTTVNDGIVSSTPNVLKNHAIIKVTDSSDYLADLNGHTSNSDDYTKAQHQAFLTAYEAVRNFENGRNQAQYDTAKQAITNLITATGGTATDTTNEWNERLATVLLSNAEQSLNKADYEKIELVKSDLVNPSLIERLADLAAYHVANDFLLPLEDEVTRHKADSTSPFNLDIVNATTLADATTVINETRNAEVDYNTKLKNRLTKVRSYYLKNKGSALTPEDLDGAETGINQNLTGVFGEFIKVFKTEDTELTTLAHYVNSIYAFFKDMNQTSLDAVASRKQALLDLDGNGYSIDTALLADVENALNSTFKYYQDYANKTIDPNLDLISVIGALPVPDTSTKGEFKTEFEALANAIIQIAEYNHGTAVQKHDDAEKAEAQTAYDLAKSSILTEGEASSTFTFLKDYLDNGVPVVSLQGITDYGYLLYGDTLKVTGTIDDDNANHEVTVTINGTTKSVTTTDKSFELTFSVDEVGSGDVSTTITVDDGKTLLEESKTLKALSVVDVTLADEVFKALINDLVDISSPTVASDIAKLVVDLKKAETPQEPTQAHYDNVKGQAVTLNGTGTTLVQLVDEKLIDSYLNWLHANNGITLEHLKVIGAVDATNEAQVTANVLDELQMLAADYKAVNGVTVAQVADYKEWIALLINLQDVPQLVADALSEADIAVITELIAQIETKVSEIPTWAESLLNKYGAELDKLKSLESYLLAQDAVTVVEESWLQADFDKAQTLVDAVTGVDATPLQDRLDAIKGVVATYEAAKALADKLLGDESPSLTELTELQDLVNELPANPKKDELQQIIEYLEAKLAVQKAIEEKNRTNLDNAKAEIEDVLDEAKKAELTAQLEIVELYVDALEKADVALSNTEKSFTELDDAKTALENLVDNPLLTTEENDIIKNKLEEVLTAIADFEDEIAATDAVEDAEESLTEDDYNTAKELVDELKDGDTKDELTGRLDKLKPNVDLAEQIRVLLEELEQLPVPPTQEQVDDVKSLVVQLPSGNVKTDFENRIAELQTFVDADKAVTRAENSKYESHVKVAQALVTALTDGTKKDYLQARLDVLTGIEKDESIIDKIVNGEDVTPQELADFTGETVYEELMDRYIEEIIELANEQGEITKEDIIQIIRLVNSFEIAKRSMYETDIQTYANELAQATIPTKNRFVEPTVMFATADYVTDESAKGEVINALATLLGLSASEVEAEIESLLAGKEEVTTGTYTVNYVTEDGELVHTETFTNIEFGNIEVKATELEGYELIGDASKTIELSKENNGLEVLFSVSKNEEVVTGSYNVKYTTEEGQVVHEETVKDVELGTVTVTATTVEGYELLGDATQSVELTSEDNTAEFIFLVKAIELIPGGTNNEPTTTTSDSSTINTENITPSTEGDSGTSKTPEPSVNTGATNPDILSLRVAALDGFVFTSSPVALTTNDSIEVTLNVSDQTYLHNTVQALAKVKAYELNPTETNLNVAKAYVMSNLEKGAYKALLLSMLGLTDVEIGDNDTPELTPVHPTPPPVVPVEPTEPPTNNGDNGNVTEPVVPIEPTNPTLPPVIDNGDGGVVIPVNPTPPTIEEGNKDVDEKEPTVENPTETEETKQEDNSSPVVTENTDGSYNWNVDLTDKKVDDLIKDGYLILTNEEITIKIPVQELEDAKGLSVSWIAVGDGHYKLVVKLDGKVISSFDSAIKVEYKRSMSYLLRGQNGEYEATPYTYKDGKFSLKVANTEKLFYFTTTKRSFSDTKGVTNEALIEEMASRHIVYGTTATTFNPYGDITYAQLSAILSRSMGLKAKYETPFTNLSQHWAKDNIQALYELGVLKEFNSNIDPNDAISYGEVIAILYRLLEIEGITAPINDDTQLASTDMKVLGSNSISVAAAMQKLNTLGVLEGYENVKSEEEIVTRTKIITAITRTLELMEKF